MDEVPPSDDPPDTLLALVGTSPTPPLLSALTFRPRRLLLAHSTGTRRRAERIAEIAQERGGIEHAETVPLGGDVFDFRAVADRLEELRPKLGESWRLCYTGGTKVMAVCAALAHLEEFPHQHRWRSYLDVSTDSAWFTDGMYRGIDSPALDIDGLAELHGVELGEAPEANPVEGLVLRDLECLVLGQKGWEVRGNTAILDPHRGLGGGRQVTAEFDAVVRCGHRVLCVEAKTGPKAIPEVAGWTVAMAQRAFGAAAGVLFVHEKAGEEADGADLRKRIKDYNPRLSGSRVFVCERSQLTRHFASARDLREEFFGAEPAAAPALPGALPAAAAPAEDHPGRGNSPLLLMGLGGSRLAVLAAARAYLPDPAALLYSRESEGELPGLLDSARYALFAAEHPGEAWGGAPGHLPRRHRRRYAGRVKGNDAPVRSADVPAVAEAARAMIHQHCRDSAPVIADITTGTKAMSLGLALAARSHGGCVTYLSPVTRRVYCHTHGPVGAFGAAAVDWKLVLKGYERFTGTLAEGIRSEPAGRVDAELLDAAAAEACDLLRGRGHEPAVWVDHSVLMDTDELPERYSADQRPTLIVTAADRALGLAAPCWSSKGRDGGWAHAAFAATKALEATCGAAGRLLALHHPGEEGSSDRAEQLRQWVAWQGDLPADEESRGAENITAHEEVYRPAVVSAAPGTTELRDAVAERLTALSL